MLTRLNRFGLVNSQFKKVKHYGHVFWLRLYYITPEQLEFCKTLSGKRSYTFIQEFSDAEAAALKLLPELLEKRENLIKKINSQAPVSEEEFAPLSYLFDFDIFNYNRYYGRENKDLVREELSRVRSDVAYRKKLERNMPNAVRANGFKPYELRWIQEFEIIGSSNIAIDGLESLITKDYAKKRNVVSLIDKLEYPLYTMNQKQAALARGITRNISAEAEI